MASYHLSAQIVKRSEGRSVIAMAAYRAGEKLKDQRRGTEADFRRRRGVEHTEIMIPEGAAAWLRDREALWNAVELIEKRSDAQLAREINMALPHELTNAQRLALVRKFVSEQFVSRGMVADIAIHRPVSEKGDDPRNYHAHVLLTLRQACSDGLRRVKTREWNSDSMLLVWRAAWADCQNNALRTHGHTTSVDHRSLEARKEEAARGGDRRGQEALDRMPELHVGPKARKAARTASPRSRDRQVGPPRPGQLGKRVVRYTTIDQGSRTEWNIRRLTSNADRFKRSAIKIERQLVRLRQRLRRYEGAILEHRSQSRRPRRTSSFGWKSPKVERSVVIGKLAHARQRRRQVLWLIDQLDRLFFALLGIREEQLVRRTVWQNRLRGRSPDPTPSPREGRLRRLDPFEG